MATPTPSREGIDATAIKALGHPARLDALRIFNERAQASPNEVAETMGVSVNYLAHHIRVLRDCGCIKLVDTAQRRGATEHYYAATEQANVTREISELLPRSMRKGITGKMVTAIVQRIAAAIDAGTFDSRVDRHVSWVPMTLDEEGWRAMVALKARGLEKEQEIESEARERLAGSGQPGIKATAVSLVFESPAAPE